MGPKERDDPGEGRRALGEKAFSSDPRGSLGVSDPPAAAPPACAVAAVAAAKSAWAEHPAPHLPSGGGGGRVRRPRGGAVCRSLPTAARASPLRVGGGSRWAPPGVPAGGGGPERACAACARGRPPRCGEPWGKGGKVLGARRPVGPGFPSPAVRGKPKPSGSPLQGRARPPAGSPSARGQRPRGCSAVRGQLLCWWGPSNVGHRPTGCTEARGTLFAKLSEAGGGAPAWLAAHRVPPSAPCLTEGPERTGPRAKHSTHHSSQGHAETSWWWGAHEAPSIARGVSNVFCPCNRHPPRLPSSFR